MLPPKRIYLVIFCISFLILSLQIILCLLLNVLAYLPYFAISFAFLGLTVAGVFSYLKYYNSQFPADEAFLAKKILAVGINILFYLLIINVYSLALFAASGQLAVSYVTFKLHILTVSILSGSLLAVAFFRLGTILSLIYKYFSGQSPRLYLLDLLGAACGCVVAVALLHVLLVSSILILLAMLTFVLADYLNRSAKRTQLANNIPRMLMLLSVFLFCFNLKTSILELKFNPNFLIGVLSPKNECQELWSRWNAYSRVSLLRYKDEGHKNYDYTFSLDQNAGKALLVPFDPGNPYPYLTYIYTSVTQKYQDIGYP